MSLATLSAEIRDCRLCEDILEPRPVLRVHPDSRILLVGQAPGSKVHATGIPWDDASGAHLLSWLGIGRTQFENPRNFAIVPMAFCYPGRGNNADLPPPPRCGQTWHARLLAHLPRVRLTLVVGQHAHKFVLGKARKRTLTETVRCHQDYGEHTLPLPHPSWRSHGWMKRNPWFEDEILPILRARVRILADTTEQT